ncbi:MAG: mechanosensitive ion channel protein, partial [Xenococcaceae cyanobacterium]
MWFYRIRAVFAAGVVCTLVTWSVPVRAQDGGATEKASFKTMIAANPNLSEALTSKDPKIPVDELKLLVKPLTLEELKTEAVGWLLLLKEKVQEISDTEIAIKRENLQI